jgi:hypothetical protein
MKIKPEHYQHMLNSMTPSRFQLDYRRSLIVAEGKAKDVEKRLRWDLLYFSLGSRWICDNLYPYADDTHIDTALRKIMKELEVRP